MKIEKINENQIKCTLEQEDLSMRGIVLSELAYGSNTAKNLFNEVMAQAFTEFGFITEDTSVMVEAIPMSSGKLVLLVTKIFDSNEPDTDLAKSAPVENEDDGFIPLPTILKGKNIEPSHPQNSHDTAHIYCFSSLNDISELAIKIKKEFRGSSSVYKDNALNQYYLVLEHSASDKERIDKISNFLSEYSTPLKGNYATLSYVQEHYEPIVKKDALIILSAL